MLNAHEMSPNSLNSLSLKTKLLLQIAIALMAIKRCLRPTPQLKSSLYGLKSLLRYRFGPKFIKILALFTFQRPYSLYQPIEGLEQGLFQRNGLKNSQMITQVSKNSLFLPFFYFFLPSFPFFLQI